MKKVNYKDMRKNQKLNFFMEQDANSEEE